MEATTGAVLELADHLVCQQIEKVTLESTSDYWRIFFYLLEARGLEVQLVNARDVKNAPGRPKTDKLDSVWQAKLTAKGLLRPSFVPPGRAKLANASESSTPLAHIGHWQGHRARYRGARKNLFAAPQ